MDIDSFMASDNQDMSSGSDEISNQSMDHESSYESDWSVHDTDEISSYPIKSEFTEGNIGQNYRGSLENTLHAHDDRHLSVSESIKSPHIEYTDDSHYMNEDGNHAVDGADHSPSFKGTPEEDRTYYLRKAQENKEWAEWHEKRAADAIAKGDTAGAKDHYARAASYRKAFKDYIAASKKCGK